MQPIRTTLLNRISIPGGAGGDAGDAVTGDQGGGDGVTTDHQEDTHDRGPPVRVRRFTERALAFFEANGITVGRLMTDNAWAYTKSKKLRRLLRKRKVTAGCGASGCGLDSRRPTHHHWGQPLRAHAAAGV